MKKIVSVFLSALIIALFCPFTSAQVENAKTPMATHEPAKSYKSYTIASYTFYVPDYYFEAESSDSHFELRTSLDALDAILMIGIEQLDATLEEYETSQKTISESYIESFPNAEILSDESITVSGLTGRMLQASGSHEGISFTIILCHCFDPNYKNIIIFCFIQNDDCLFDYSTDALKAFNSITVEHASEATHQPIAKTTKQPTAKPTAKPTATPKRQTVSYDSFYEVKMGMTIDEVKKILGDNGELFTSTDFLNVKTEIYSWTGSSFSMILITFSNGIVVEKTQSGLNQLTATATIAKFSQISSGMTYEQVKAIMGGDGCMISESSMMGIETAVYQWNGSSLYNMAIITFQNGKVFSTSQQGLS